MAGITTEEWLKALEDAFRQAEGEGLASRDIAKALDVSPTTAKNLVRAAIEAGEMEFAGRQKRQGIDRRVCWVPVYRPVGQ